MMKQTERRASGSRFWKDRLGNFSMMTAIVFPVMLAAGGVAIDLTNMVMTKAQLQDAADAAALAAASAMANDGMSAAEAKLLALSFMKTHIASSSTMDSGEGHDSDADYHATNAVTITETATQGSGKAFKVAVTVKQTVNFNPFTRLLGQTSAVLSANSTAESATESKNALSMFLVLDRSGSMSFITNEIQDKNASCQNYTSSNWNQYPNLKSTKPCYVKKIAALKLAVASLVTQLNIADPKKQYVRMGAVSYNDAMQKETALNWGTAGALSYVNALPSIPTGGTDSSAAFKTAYQKVTASTEDNEHKNKNGQTPTKYIIFMTDGENTHLNGVSNRGAQSDAETKKWCDEARKDKIEVFSVAFMAPTAGQNLLKYCATTGSNYFAAEEMDELVEAFKAIGERASAIMSRLTH